MAIGNYRALAWTGALLVAMAALVAPLATRVPAPVSPVVLSLDDDEPAVWRFIPVDVLPGGAEVETELPLPPDRGR